MTNVDQFESLFRAASKEVFRHQIPSVESVLVVTDLAEHEATHFADRTKAFLGVLGSSESSGSGPVWSIVAGEEFSTVPDLLGIVEKTRPDLICAYRHLHSAGWKWPFTLGEYVEVLTQATKTPVMVLPHPEAGCAADHALQDTKNVMAITDHLTGDHRLVNWAVRLTEPGGRLFLTHVEDETTYERIINAISKIPDINTDVAREELIKQLIKLPHDYIGSCRRVLDEVGMSITIEDKVTVGHRLKSYKNLVEAHAIDLLVFNTKDEDQLAMHGLAYPLAVELRQIPLLML